MLLVGEVACPIFVKTISCDCGSHFGLASSIFGNVETWLLCYYGSTVFPLRIMGKIILTTAHLISHSLS